jgi:hypothetical protein
MNRASQQLTRFRARRLTAIAIGIAFPAILLMVALVGFRDSVFTGPAAFACVAIAAGGSFLAAWIYRCPNCQKGPEPNIPMFYPESCCNCGTPLR